RVVPPAIPLTVKGDVPVVPEPCEIPNWKPPVESWLNRLKPIDFTRLRLTSAILTLSVTCKGVAVASRLTTQTLQAAPEDTSTPGLSIASTSWPAWAASCGE